MIISKPVDEFPDVVARGAVETNFDAAPALACASALFILGTLSTLITPAVLQGWAGQFHWTESRLGGIATVELVGLALGSTSAFFWQRRARWRRIGRWSILVIVVTNAACVFSDSFMALCGLRFISGVAGGVLVGVYTAYLSNTRSPERFLAVTTLAQITTQAALMSLSSVLLAHWGVNGMYAMLGGSVAILLPTLRFLPPGWPQSAPAVDGEAAPAAVSGRAWILGVLILAAFIPFEIFQGGTFAFLHQFGLLGAHLQSSETLHVIGVAAIVSALGPIAAYFLADRAGVFVPLAGSILIMLAMMVGLTNAPYSALLMLFYLSVMQATWLFAICYLYAGLIMVNNRLTQVASPVSAICLGAGASLMAMAIEWRGLAGIFWLSFICLGLVAVAVLPPLYAAERRRRA
jgi:predicted MFS family arabinose efflux permease